MNRLSRGLLVTEFILALWWIPVPDGLTLQAWRLFVIFAATILGFILQPLPLGAVALAGVTLSTLTGILPPSQALSGFSNTTIWLNQKKHSRRKSWQERNWLHSVRCPETKK